MTEEPPRGGGVSYIGLPGPHPLFLHWFDRWLHAELGALLGVEPEKAEQIASRMAMESRLQVRSAGVQLPCTVSF